MAGWLNCRTVRRGFATGSGDFTRRGVLVDAHACLCDRQIAAIAYYFRSIVIRELRA